jgi:thiol-disulfide isomerase/thioredoxin
MLRTTAVPRQTMDVLLFSATAAAAYFYAKANTSVASRAKAVSKKTDLSAAELGRTFPSLDLTTTPLVGLLFAASWCPDCWDFVPAVERVAAGAKTEIRIHYISSDRTAEEMANYYNKTVFGVVPFDKVSERSALKRHFLTCAKKEMDTVGIKERQHGIPTLIVLEAATGRVLTTAGVEDCTNNSPEKAVGLWKGYLQH